LVVLHETLEVVKSKFVRSVEAHRTRHCKNLKSLFSKHGISVNRETIVAYFLGMLRAIAYDSKSFIQGEGLEWSEFEELVESFIDEAVKVVDDIVRND